MTTTWRIIKSPPSNGAWNMAVDEAIHESIGKDGFKPTLRLYAWHPPCISLGYAQPSADVDFKNLTLHNWEIVRRITGGRAILHTNELTYSVIGSHEEPVLKDGVLASYRRISKALLEALHILDVRGQAVPQPQSTSSNNQNKEPVCFEVPSHYEISVHGKKLIGSAQARKKGGVLQHGTLPLHGDLTEIVQGLSFPDEQSRQAAAERLLLRATNIEGVLKKTISWDVAAQAFVTAFSKTLNIKFELSELTPFELNRANELVKEKYAHPAWTKRI